MVSVTNNVLALTTNAAASFKDFEIVAPRMITARAITVAEIVFHARHSGDDMPDLVDIEFCRAQLFEGLITRGTLKFAIANGE